MLLKKLHQDCILEQNNLIKVFSNICNIEDLDFLKIRPSDKVTIQVAYEDIFIKNAIRQNFIINIDQFAEINQKTILRKIKNLTAKEIKKLLVISSYNALLADLLNKNKINGIIFKGVVLSILTKRKKTSRPCSDIDLLVDKKDVYKTIKILQEQGFKIKYGFFKNKSNSLIEKYYLFSQKALIISKEIKELNLILNIDLHWDIITTCPNMLSFSELWKNRKIINLNGVKINTLNYYYSYLTLCYNSAKNQWNNLNNLLDIALISSRLSNNEKYKLNKIPVINKTNQLIYFITNNKKFLFQKNYDKIDNYKYKNIKYIFKSQFNLSNSKNRKKEVNIWRKFDITMHRISICETLKDKIRQVTINLIPVSLFIDNNNLIRINPIFVLKKISTKIYIDTINLINKNS